MHFGFRMHDARHVRVYGIGISILSPYIGGVCTVPKVHILQTSHLMTPTISLTPRLIYMIVLTCIFFTITKIVCIYPHIQLILLPEREPLTITSFIFSFSFFIKGCQPLNNPT